MDKKILEKWNNTCIRVLSEAHGKQVIEFWKSINVNTHNFSGNSKNFPYYGLYHGFFTCKSLPYNVKILTLEEAIIIRDKTDWIPQFGEMVEVTMTQAYWYPRIYIGQKDDKYHCVALGDDNNFHETTNSYTINIWNYMRKPEPPKPLEISLEEAKEIIAKEKGISVEQVNLNFKIN